MEVRPASPAGSPLGVRRILSFWFPLAATWLMMAIEGPYVAAIIARLPDSTVNLAAYGVTFSFAFLFEAPVIMIMTAANALVRGRQSFLALRRFVYILNAAVTAALVVCLWPPIFRFVTDRLIGLPPDIAALTHTATALLVPWPASIGYRRFYQGILVRHHMPRRVAYGTVIRLGAMSVTAGILALASHLAGAWIGSLALVTGVIAEAAASRWMAGRIVRTLLAGDGTATDPLTARGIARFYYPLALTSLMAIAVNPLVTFLVGHSRAAIESLAVLPVITGFVFVFRSGAIAYQEVAVLLVGSHREHERPVARVAFVLAAASVLGLSAVLFTPLAGVWLGAIAGLSPGMAAFALWPARVLAIVPALEYLLTFQRARFILARRTRAITFATAIEVICLGLAVAVGIRGFGLVGALAATIAILAGRVAGNLLLLTLPLEDRVRRPEPGPAERARTGSP
jgi:hypothetical protein